ncbi:hypothetical protein RND81_07G007000 [Saponaria officinalis]|uniref:Pectinesterase inhibitor domain-containing protein n=1 Tax=Saponaria officinalis TaxID=3572 RepID=A0AAW1JKW1_SAPOF
MGGGRKMVMMMMAMWVMTVVEAQQHPQKMLDTLCGAATYKEACRKSLEREAQTQGATPQMLVESGVKAALDEIDKAASKLMTTNNGGSAVESCKHLLDQAKDRLQGAMSQVRDANNFKDAAQVFDLRIKLGDVNTFATTCIDEAPPQLQPLLRDDTSYATQLSVDMLDIVTVFNQALSLNLLPSPSRRLLAFS